MIKKLVKFGLVLTLVISSLFMYAKPLHAEGELELLDINSEMKEGYLYTTLTLSDTSDLDYIDVTYKNYEMGHNFSAYSFLDSSSDNYEINGNQIIIKTFVNSSCFDEKTLLYFIDEVRISKNDETSVYYTNGDEVLIDKQLVLDKSEYAVNFLTNDDFYFWYDEFCDSFSLFKGTNDFSSLHISAKHGYPIEPYDLNVINNPAMDENCVVGEIYDVDVEFKVNDVNGYKSYSVSGVKAKIVEPPKVFENFNVEVINEQVILKFVSDYPGDIYEFRAVFRNENGREFIIDEWHPEFEVDGNQISYASPIHPELYDEEAITTYSLETLQFHTENNGDYFYTSDDNMIKNQKFVINPFDNVYTHLTVDDIKLIFEEGTPNYISLYKGSDYCSNNFEFKAYNIYFQMVDILNNPVYDENAKTNELIEVSVLVKGWFKGKALHYIVDHVPAIVYDVSSNLKGISLDQQGNTVNVKVEHENYDNIEYIDLTFIQKDEFFNPNEINVRFYNDRYDSEPFNLSFDLEQYDDFYRTTDRDYFLDSIKITNYESETEFYTLENTDFIKGLEIHYDKKENPYKELNVSDINYRFTTIDRYLKIDPNTNESLFDNIQFMTKDQSAILEPRIIYFDETSANGIFEVSVIVQAIYGNEVKEFKIDHIPAKYEEPVKAFTDVRVSMNKNKFHLELDYRLDERIRNYSIVLVNEENPTKEIYIQMPRFNATKPTIVIDHTVEDVYFPNKVTTYKFKEINLGRDTQSLIIKGNDPLIKDLRITLDPKDSPFYSSTVDEALWYFERPNETLYLQKTTGKVDYSKINIASPLEINNQFFYINKFEIIDNPALKPNANANKLYNVDAYVTYKTIGGLERTFFLKGIPARVIEPIGKIEGAKTDYHEYTMPYTDYLVNKMDEKWEKENRKSRPFTVVLNNNKTKEISVEPFTASFSMVDDGFITYFESTTYYDVGLQYIFEGVKEDLPFYNEYVNDIYFVNKNILYLIDENGNIVDRTGKILMKYDDRPIKKLKSNNENIELNSKEGSLPSYTEINAVENDSFDDVYDNYVAYDMSLDAKGEEVQPADAVQVGITVPSDMDEDGLKVVYIDENGNPTDEVFDVNVENGVAYFETTHFSTYALVATNKKQEVIVPDIDENSDLENLNITVDGQKLVYGKDYEVSVKETITGNIKLVEVTIHFIGEYANLKDVVKTYEMSVKEEMNEPNITVPEITEKTDLDNLVIKDGDKVLVKDKDYTITKIEKDGQVTVTITFIGDYAQIDPIVKEYPVTKGESTDTSDSMNIIIYVVLMVLSLIAMLFVRRKHQI